MQDLSNYSLAQLRQLDAQLIEELKTRHYLSVSHAREQILHIAQSAGMSVQELLTAKGLKLVSGKTVAVKFQHPDDPTKKWTGRGRQPAWVKDWTASGKTLDDAKV